MLPDLYLLRCHLHHVRRIVRFASKIHMIQEGTYLQQEVTQNIVMLH
jgi:hypothetical protein